MSTLTITVPPGKRYDYDGEVELPFQIDYSSNPSNVYVCSRGFLMTEIKRKGAPGTKVDRIEVWDSWDELHQFERSHWTTKLAIRIDD